MKEIDDDPGEIESHVGYSSSDDNSLLNFTSGHDSSLDLTSGSES